MATQVNIKSSGTTYAQPQGSSSTSRASGLVPAPSVALSSGDHRRHLKRWFIGPMLEKIVASEIKKYRIDWRNNIRLDRKQMLPESPLDSVSDTCSDSSSDGESTGPPVDRGLLKDYFLDRGGQEDDWEGNRDVQRSIRREIKRKWKESGWYNVWKGEKRKRKAGEGRKWVGKSFIIGDVLGTGENTIHGSPSLSLGQSFRRSATSPTGTRSSPIPLETPLASPNLALTVPGTLGRPNERNGFAPGPSSAPTNTEFTTANPDTSTTGLLHTSTFFSRPEPAERPHSEIVTSPVKLDRIGTTFTAGSDGHDPLAPVSGLRSALKSVSDRKGKRKSVNFGDPSTAPPMEVLARSGPGVFDTSAEAATTEATATMGVRQEAPLNPKDIIMRDRMLVKVSYNRSEGLPHPYDEIEASRHPDTLEEDWAEFLVCWRRNHLELYEDWSLPGKKYFTNGLHLAFIVPLRRPHTRLSLYSAVDSSFCITCRPAPVTNIKTAPAATATSSKRTILHRAPSGTNIFVFNLKSRSRGIDWMWHIWRALGGELPEFLEIHSPDLESRVRIDIPEVDARDGGEGYKELTRQHVLDICQNSLRGLPSWDELIAPELKLGRTLELCWRKGPNLEWIWVDQDIDGLQRDWAVVYFAGVRQFKNPTLLEIRLAQHAPTKVILSTGAKLSEPPAVEGYLYRINPSTQNRALIYLSSQDGNLFTMSTAHSYPPGPPGPPATVAKVKDPISVELRRGAQQILNSDGYIDMRSISSVRRALGVIFPKSVEVTNNRGNIPGVNDAGDDDGPQIVDDENQTLSDAEDAGGDEFLNGARNRANLRLKRTFELILRNGRVVRLEAYSALVALEWIAKLRALVSYWTRRHRIDARQEMDLTHAVKGRPRWGSPEIVPNAVSDYPHIGEFWNWCVLEGCRPIVKAGRLFEKRGLHKQYKHMYHVLTHGHIVQFHLTSSKSAHHHRSRSINLIDSYVYSGQLAVATLPQGYEGTNPTEAIPKRYQDGLEAEDSDEDVTFIVWYRPHTAHIATDGNSEPGHGLKEHRLGGKHKLLICKARSKLERDSWCFALNTEIERLARTMPARERRLRDNQPVR